jgi:hypothetical protein
MNDAHFSSLRSDPSPEFAARLRERLEGGQRPLPADRVFPDPAAAPAPAAKPGSKGPGLPRRRLLIRLAASIAVVGAAGALLAVPSVRASAATLLARFRAINFVAIPVDKERAAEIEAKAGDLEAMVEEHLQVLQEPGAPVPVGSIEQASTAAGIEVRLPSWLPPDVEQKSVDVTGPGLVRVRVDSVRLEQLMKLLGIGDLEAPHALNGKVIDVKVPSVVRVRYEVRRDNNDGARAEFVQAQAPEITLPDGADLPALGEIGLRILGLSAEDARQFAASIDWRSTALVPVPWGATSVKQVEINGHQGIAVERQYVVENSGDTAGVQATITGQDGNVETVAYERLLIWSDGSRVFGMNGNFRLESMLTMAYSIR